MEGSSDDNTFSLTRSKFARVYIEVDLANPLKRGLWIGDENHRIFVVALNECLPMFCYFCGMVGHGFNSYSRWMEEKQKRTIPPSYSDREDLRVKAVMFSFS